MTIFARIVRRLAASARSGAKKFARAVRRRTGPLRVGVDIRPFYEPLTGIGWYLFHLLEELSKRDDLELVYFGDAFHTDQGPVLHVELPPGRFVYFDFRGIAAPRSALLAARGLFPALIWLEQCDLLFGANYFLPRPMSAVARRRVVTVHDLTFRRFPELLQQETLANLDRAMTRELFRADAVISVSRATRHDLHSYYSLDEAKSFTIHSGLAPLPEGEIIASLSRPYLLFVSTIEPRKDLDTLLGAFEMLKASGRFDGSLVVVGRIGWKSDETVARISRSRWKAEIHHLDYVSRKSLSAIYRGAEIFIFPSLYEGFGFPMLEAMACGAPVIAARSSSLPEVGGDAALYFQPGNRHDLAERISDVLRDPELRADLIERGLQRVKIFDWSSSANETASLFRTVADW